MLSNPTVGYIKRNFSLAPITQSACGIRHKFIETGICILGLGPSRSFLIPLHASNPDRFFAFHIVYPASHSKCHAVKMIS